MLSEEASTFIAGQYALLRGMESNKTLPVTARTLETMIRLATAHAKSRLSDIVEEQDAKAAKDLINFAYFNDAEPWEKTDKPKEDEDYDGGDDDDRQGGSQPRRRNVDDDSDDDDGGAAGPDGKRGSAKRSASQRTRTTRAGVRGDGGKVD